MFLEIKADTMSVDVFSTCVTRSSAATVLTLLDKKYVICTLIDFNYPSHLNSKKRSTIQIFCCVLHKFSPTMVKCDCHVRKEANGGFRYRHLSHIFPSSRIASIADGCVHHMIFKPSEWNSHHQSKIPLSYHMYSIKGTILCSLLITQLYY